MCLVCATILLFVVFFHFFKMYHHNIIFCGDQNTGKSALYNAVLGVPFEEGHQSTSIASHAIYNYPIEEGSVQINIWDISGNPDYTKLIEEYFTGIDAFVVVLDTTDPNSFFSVEQWIDKILNVRSEDVPYIFVVATKIDDNERSSITKESIKEWENKHQIKTFQVSARSNKGLPDFFHMIIDVILERCEKPYPKLLPHVNEKKNTSLTPTPANKNSIYCCNLL